MRKRPNANDAESDVQPESVSLSRISKTLALIATREFEQPERIEFLSSVGFSLREISAIVGLKYDAVRMTIQRQKRK
jgi:hypothetical protein